MVWALGGMKVWHRLSGVWQKTKKQIQFSVFCKPEGLDAYQKTQLIADAMGVGCWQPVL